MTDLTDGMTCEQFGGECTTQNCGNLPLPVGAKCADGMKCCIWR